MVIATASNKLFKKLCDAMGRPELVSDERFRSHRGRSSRRHEINEIVNSWVRGRSSDEVLTALGPEGADLPCARVSSPHELVDDPQLIARNMIERHPHPDLTEVVFHGNPLQFSDAEPRERKLAPALAEHNVEIYTEIGLAEDEIRRLSEAGVI